MTIYQEKLEAKCQAARDSAPCLSTVCERKRNGEPICDVCKDSNEQYVRNATVYYVNEAIRVLEHYGFTVTEK
jgi:hypothetical protein